MRPVIFSYNGIWRKRTLNSSYFPELVRNRQSLGRNDVILAAVLEQVMQKKLGTHSNSCANIDERPANAVARPV